MISNRNNEGPVRATMSLRRLVTRILMSKMGIRAVALLIFVVLTYYIAFQNPPLTIVEETRDYEPEVQPAEAPTIQISSETESLDLVEPPTNVSDIDYGFSTTVTLHKTTSLPTTTTTRATTTTLSTTSTSTEITTTIQPETFLQDPLEPVQTDFNIEKLLDIVKLPNPGAYVQWNQFDDDTVKVQLSSRLKPKVWSQKNRLRVFVVLHSHNDPGWLLTFEQYYLQQTKYILDYMLKYLTEDPQLKFIWCEISFFSLWWNDLTSEKRLQVKRLVTNKQLEFVGGGWVMPDEANVHYLSYITQITEGHQFLKQHLNYTAKNGWAIDPFGISTSLHFLQKQAKINSTVVNRVHYILKQFLREKQSVEFLWRQQWDSTGSSDILSYLMPYYSYDQTQTCGPDSKATCTNYKEPGTDITTRAQKLLIQLRKKSLIFKTNNLLWPVGGDFQWRTKNEWSLDLPNLKRIVKYLNTAKNTFMDIKFATLDDYFKAVRAEIGKGKFKPKTLSGDFFTYSGERLDYWSGYFTSRMFHKASERQLRATLRSAQLLYTLMTAEVAKHWGSLNFKFVGELLKAIVSSRRNLSLFQHHDGITGTSKAKVVIDYAQKLYESMLKCQFVQQQSLFVLTNLHKFKLEQLALEDVGNDPFYDPSLIKTGNYQNNWKTHFFDINEMNPQRIITVFNSLEFASKNLVLVGVKSPNVKVLTLNDEEVEAEICPIFSLSEIKVSGASGTDSLKPEIFAKDDGFELYFLATLRAFEIKSYKLVYDPITNSKTSKSVAHFKIFNAESNFSAEFKNAFGLPASQEPESSENAGIHISNGHFEVAFSAVGTATSVKVNGTSRPLALSFRYYKSEWGSGVYSFNPNGKQSRPIKSEAPAIVVVEGKLQSYVEVWLPTVRHKLKLLRTKGLEDNALHIENVIDITREHNFELLMRMTTNVSSGDAFYTDSNGFQMMRRKTRKTIPIQGNYYPVPSSAFIEDSKTRLTILTAQPGAGASFSSGELEIIQDRIVHMDDGHGMGEDGSDNLQTVSKYRVLLEDIKKPSPALDDEETSLVPFLSLAGHHHINSLLHPLRGFLLKDKSERVTLESVRSTTPTKIMDHSEVSSRNVNETTITEAAGTDVSLPSVQKIQIRDYAPGSSNYSIPCDIFLASAHPLPEYRDSQEKNDSRIFITPGSIGLLLQRVNFDGRFHVGKRVSERCSVLDEDAGRLQIGGIFNDLFQDTFQKTSLSFAHNDGEFVYDLVTVYRMHVYGLIAKYRNLKETPWKNPVLFNG